MPGTEIQLVTNKSSDYLLFLVLENAAKNQYLDPAPSSKKVNCAVPWSSSHEEFLRKGIIIINRFKKTVLGYIWQDNDGKDDRVRLWYTGWELPTEENRMPGYSIVGGKINLIIDKDGKISAEQASP